MTFLDKMCGVPGSSRALPVLLLQTLLLLSVGVHSTAITTSDTSQAVCTSRGRVYTNSEWYGFIVHKAFHRDFAKIQYYITYPVKEAPVNLLIYYDDQVKQLTPSMTCEQRLGVLPADNNQVIRLTAANDSQDSSGCSVFVNNVTLEQFYVCRGERIFRSSVPRTWFFGLSRCNSHGAQLILNYAFNITGFYGECEDDPLNPSSGWNDFAGFLDNDHDTSSNEEKLKYLAISLGIIAGLALIVAAVFFGLWFIGLQAAKTKGSSVTSSQATMTQDDIFYVNPSLSDQGQADYSQSGSENYYEVIPERRSYESINTGLTNGGVHMRHLRAAHAGLMPHHPHHAHHLAHHHAHLAAAQQQKALQQAASGSGNAPASGENLRGYPVFEDYPPPPYQPPKGLGIAKQGGGIQHGHTLSLPPGHGHRQRPTLIHHAYHSSVVPTSSALGHQSLNPSTSSGLLGNNNSGASQAMGLSLSGMEGHGLGQGHHPMASSSGHGMSNNPMGGNLINSSSGGLLHNSNTGPSLQTSMPSTLGTFVGGPGPSHPSLSNSGIGLGQLTSHGQMMSASPHLSANTSSLLASSASPPITSLAVALSSASSHAPLQASGQSETSA